MNYNQSTRARLADVKMGMRVDKASFALASTLQLFNIVAGRVALLRLLGEFDGVVAPDGSATTLQIIVLGTGLNSDSPKYCFSFACNSSDWNKINIAGSGWKRPCHLNRAERSDNERSAGIRCKPRHH